MRQKKVKILITTLVFAVLLIIAAGVVIYLGKGMIEERQASIDDLEWEINSNKMLVYVASSDIIAGEKIETGKNVYEQQIYTGLDSEYYIDESNLGDVAVVDISYGTPIMTNMVSAREITKDSREYEIAVASLMTDQMEHDYVDIRIMFPNGEDMIILPKKEVRNLKLDQCVFYTYLNEDEILRMASATIDAFHTTGARMDATRDVESNLQDAATPTYLVRAETIDLMNKDPNITSIAKTTLNLQARLDLETRIKGLTEDQLKATAAGHDLEDTAKNSVLLGQMYEDGESDLFMSPTTDDNNKLSEDEDEIGAGLGRIDESTGATNNAAGATDTKTETPAASNENTAPIDN